MSIHWGKVANPIASAIEASDIEFDTMAFRVRGGCAREHMEMLPLNEHQGRRDIESADRLGLKKSGIGR
jgi:hypothetical protein